MSGEPAKLTKDEKKCIGIIWVFFCKNNYMPSASQVGRAKGKSKQYGYKVCKKLTDKFWLVRDEQLPRYRFTALAIAKIERAIKNAK